MLRLLKIGLGRGWGKAPLFTLLWAPSTGSAPTERWSGRGQILQEPTHLPPLVLHASRAPYPWCQTFKSSADGVMLAGCPFPPLLPPDLGHPPWSGADGTKPCSLLGVGLAMQLVLIVGRTAQQAERAAGSPLGR